MVFRSEKDKADDQAEIITRRHLAGDPAPARPAGPLDVSKDDTIPEQKVVYDPFGDPSVFRKIDVKWCQKCSGGRGNQHLHILRIKYGVLKCAVCECIGRPRIEGPGAAKLRPSEDIWTP